jgi:hypothetical protein
MMPAALPGHPLQIRMEVQWAIGAALGADDGADESTSPQAGISHICAETDVLAADVIRHRHCEAGMARSFCARSFHAAKSRLGTRALALTA